MKISKRGIDLIKSFEGCRLHAYRCPAGVWTIGWGHTTSVRSGDIITQEQAEDFLIKDLAKYEHQVNKFDDTYHWTQNEFDALVSFAFNIGNIIGLTKAGTRSKKQIADAILLYNKAAGVTLPGLIRRRSAEHNLFCAITQESTKSNEEIAKEVIAGLWGNGKERNQRLREAGYNPSAVQRIVNKILKG